jgi:CRISPR-associated protein Cas2
MQRILLIYDITADRIRAKVADVCEDYGLDRIQFSTFCGKLSRNHQDAMMVRIEELLGEGDGNIQLIPISEDDWDKRLEVGYARW